MRLPRRALRSNSGSASSQLPGGDIGRRLQHQIAQHVGDHIEPLAVFGQARGVPLRRI